MPLPTRPGRLALLVSLLLAVTAFVFWRNASAPRLSPDKTVAYDPPAATGPSSPAPLSSAQTAADAALSPAFRHWLTDYQQAAPAARSALLPAGLAIAEERRAHLARLIRENPAQALAEGLRWHEYAAVPAELRASVERPFSAAAAYDHYPVCGAAAGTPDHLATLALPEASLAAFTYGRRAGLMSKHSIPAQGIALDGAAALDEHALRELSPAEIPAVRDLFPAAQSDPSRSFLTGAPITGAPVVALAGGRLYHFANHDELDRLNLALGDLDNLPGPNAGSDALYQAMPAEDNASNASASAFPLA